MRRLINRGLVVLGFSLLFSKLSFATSTESDNSGVCQKYAVQAAVHAVFSKLIYEDGDLLGSSYTPSEPDLIEVYEDQNTYYEKYHVHVTKSDQTHVYEYRVFVDLADHGASCSAVKASVLDQN